MSVSEYFRSISQSATTIFEGMVVTFSHLLRKPTTVQYPDRTEKPMTEMLPPRYRGLLEVQLDICTGCRRCARVCPIECIVVETAKNPESKQLEMTRFDIDIAKCMFCGLCVEACKFESSGALRHTREFEGATDDLSSLIFRFVPDEPVPLAKMPKDKTEIQVGAYGPYAREARERAMRDNPALFARLRAEAKAEAAGAAPPAAASS
jgi:formate hydrogenlyase subunit 6/NADH:ubiquinone oxidoreductase subunit I